MMDITEQVNNSRPRCIMGRIDANSDHHAQRVRRSTAIFGGLLLAVASLVPNSAMAAEGHVITVTGTGKVEALPDRVEMSGTVAGEGELAADAVKKYRENRRRVFEAVEALKMKGLSVTGGGMSVTSGGDATNLQQAMILGGGNQNPAAAAKISVRETLTVTLDGVQNMKAEELLDTVIKLVDSAKDAGLTIGAKPLSMIEIQLRGNTPESLARFRLHETEVHRQGAYAKAMENARGNAERLAKLAGVKVGKVLSIRESGSALPTAANSSSSSAYASYMRLMMGMGDDSSAPEYTSNSFQRIPISVALDVQFEIQ